MTTKEQAIQAAEDILAFQRVALIEARNARARRVSWYFRVAGLGKKEPYMQEELFNQAALRVASRPTFWFAQIVWIAAVTVVWYWFLPSATAMSIVTFLVAIFGMHAMRVPLVRRQLVSLLQAESSLASSDA